MPEVFIIAALTADGCIGKNSGHAADWTSKADKKRFVALTKDAGVMVMGFNTWKTLPFALPGRVNIVYADPNQEGDFTGAERTSLPPEELIASLDARGFKKIAVCGGSHIYTTFMKSGLVTKIYLTIEQVLFGKGVSLFNEQLPESVQLKLVTSEATPEGTLLLEYDVLKS